MFNIIRKDWLVKWFLPVLFISFFSILLLVDSESKLKEFILPVIAWSSILPLIIWGWEEKFKGRTMICSLPIRRKTFVYESYLSGWTFSLAGFLSILVFVYMRTQSGVEPTISFVEIIDVKVILDLLWFLTLIKLIYFPIYSRFNGNVAGITFTVLLFLLILPEIINPDNPTRGAEYGEDFLERVSNFIFEYQASPTELWISFVLLIVVNFLILKLSEFLFSRNNLVT